MKRLIPLLLLALLLAGCDLRNRRSSEEFIPTGTYAPAASYLTPEAGDSLLPVQKTPVKTILSYDGEIPLTVPRRSYSYRLPMIDLAGPQAAGINQELENRFGTLIRQSLEAMERYEDPILERLSYSSFTLENILTLRVDRLDFDGASASAFYTVEATTGAPVSVSTLFTAVGVTEDPNSAVDRALTELFSARFGALEGADASHTTAFNRTQTALFPLTANRMHLTEDGRLVVALELFAPDGGSSVQELVFPGGA